MHTPKREEQNLSRSWIRSPGPQASQPSPASTLAPLSCTQQESPPRENQLRACFQLKPGRTQPGRNQPSGRPLGPFLLRLFIHHPLYLPHSALHSIYSVGYWQECSSPQADWASRPGGRPAAEPRDRPHATWITASLLQQTLKQTASAALTPEQSSGLLLRVSRGGPDPSWGLRGLKSEEGA